MAARNLPGCRPLGMHRQLVSYPKTKMFVNGSTAFACVLLAGYCTAQPPVGPSEPVLSAAVDNIAVDPQHRAVHFDIRNLGTHPITAFSARLTQLQAAGTEIQCNAGGQDMIDWSDAAPGSSVIVYGMRRQWIPSVGALHSARYFIGCQDTSVPTAWRVTLTLILFDDGSGEGDQRQRMSFLKMRQQERDVRVKWIDRFSGLRAADDFHLAASQLYEDLENAVHTVEVGAATADANRSLASSLDKLRGLALRLADVSRNHKKPATNSVEDWLITDLEQRTQRLIRGAGDRGIEDPP